MVVCIQKLRLHHLVSVKMLWDFQKAAKPDLVLKTHDLVYLVKPAPMLKIVFVFRICLKRSRSRNSNDNAYIQVLFNKILMDPFCSVQSLQTLKCVINELLEIKHFRFSILSRVDIQAKWIVIGKKRRDWESGQLGSQLM